MNYLFVIPPSKMKIMPSGISYVAASLKQHNFNVFGLNLDFEEKLQYAIEYNITEHNIDVLCITGLSPDYVNVRNIINIAKKHKPLIKIVIGGGLVSTEPELVISNIGYKDCIGIIGQGEKTIYELAYALRDKKDLSQIDGLIYFSENNELIKTNPRKEIEDFVII